MEINISRFIDYTLLKATAKVEDFEKLCSEAKGFQFYSVCVPPYMVKECKGFLIDTGVKITTVIGFPLGYNTVQTKVFETVKAIEDGADEIDAVINVSALKSGKFDYVLNEIKELRKASGKHVLKIIIETCYLNNDEIVQACAMVSESGADFVKTSTGFGTDGAKIDDVKLIKKSIPDYVKIKASGAIKTFEQAQEFIKAGALRIGTSSTLEQKILTGTNI